MDAREILTDGFGRVREVVHAVLTGLDPAVLDVRPDAAANSVAWLVWHLTRVQDDHVADAFGVEQVWIAQGWVRRMDLPLADTDTGYGHGPGEVASVTATTEQLLGYLDAVTQQTVALLATVGDGAFDRIVDERWDPPVTLGVRLVSVLSDDLQHAGQAAYLRGWITRQV